MTRTTTYLLLTLLAAVMVSCSHEDEVIISKVKYLVAMPWQKGELYGEENSQDSTANESDATRAASFFATRAVVSPGTPENVMPTYVFVEATQGGTTIKFRLSQDGSASSVAGYESYRNVTNIVGNATNITPLNLGNYEYVAKARTDQTDASWQDSDIPAFGTVDFLKAEGAAYVKKETPHVLFTMAHQTALVRFVIGVKDDALRKVQVKNITVETQNSDGTWATPATTSWSPEGDDAILNTSGTVCSSIYVDPGQVNLLNRKIRLTANYDVKDKKGKLVRENITVSNSLALDQTKIEKEKYYDVLITINPDYLYGLSDNDINEPETN